MSTVNLFETNYVKYINRTDFSDELSQATLPIGITEFDAEHPEISSQNQIDKI